MCTNKTAQPFGGHNSENTPVLQYNSLNSALIIPLELVKLQHNFLSFLHECTFIALLSSNHNLQYNIQFNVSIKIT